MIRLPCRGTDGEVTATFSRSDSASSWVVDCLLEMGADFGGSMYPLQGLAMVSPSG